MKREKFAAVVFAAAIVLGLAASAGAVDGTIEINQAKVLANGGSFPYVISSPGSYRLTGNLTVPANTNGINVTASKVTIDLNGFSISGPGNSGGTPIGINASPPSQITVENGTVTGFGIGVEVGAFSILRKVHADANGNDIIAVKALIEGCTANNSSDTTANFGAGIGCFGACIITGNTAGGNANYGIVCNGDGCVVSGNTMASNTTGTGVIVSGSGGLVTGNTIVGNAGGLFANDTTTLYGGNVFKNSSNVSGGTSLRTNLCNGTLC
jgi:parallel beta-helix repeat protein